MANANIDYEGSGPLVEGCVVKLEVLTDSDWGGCKRTRRSRSSAHFYLGGSLIGSHVRAQKSIALSSGEAEFIAMIGGASELVFLKDCLAYILKSKVIVEASALM